MKTLFDQEKTRLLAQGHKMVPVILETQIPQYTPSEAAMRLGTSQKIFLLESADCGNDSGRFSYLGIEPEMTLRILNNNTVLTTAKGERTEECADPAALIDRILTENATPDIPGLPPFTGGFAGAFAYDFYKYTETTLQMNNPNPDSLNDADLMFFRTIAAFDHQMEKLYLITNIPARTEEADYLEAVARLSEFALLLDHSQTEEIPKTITGEIDNGADIEAYGQKVEKAKEYIRAGDIFQVVPSNRIRIEAGSGCSLFPVYERLRAENPSPYMYYLNFGDFEAAGSSPETLIRKTGTCLLTVPIAGTRPRGADEETDRKLQNDLLSDPKELAEHNMLVDLARNDIGRIAKTGSVSVKDYLHIRRFKRVMHLCTTVTGTIKPELTAMRALCSMLPAGTLSGAPKIRACEIIEELETEKRGLYGGCAGYIGTNGNTDLCIAIRTAFRKDSSIIVQSGGGVVADSDPDSEYMETRHKAGAVLEALEEAV